MSRRFVRSPVLFAFALLAGATTPAAAQVAFDGFLAGLDAGCTRTPVFQAWQDGLVARHVPANDRETPPPVDLGAVAAGIGEARGVDKGEYVEVTVPLAGTFGGVPVRRLVFSFGKENGIYGYALEFAATRPVVEKAFRAKVRRSAAAIPKDEEGMGGSTGLDFDRRVALWCDFSN
ncbi:MAG: hypothetical protein GX458_19475 [Phyllobacteriaceae bacterium]|nr:hypothetical protein [Phyllobacteriaceae bacterium]